MSDIVERLRNTYNDKLAAADEIERLRGAIAARDKFWTGQLASAHAFNERMQAERDAAHSLLREVLDDYEQDWPGPSRFLMRKIKAAINAARSEAALDRMAQDAREQGLDYEPDAARGEK